MNAVVRDPAYEAGKAAPGSSPVLLQVKGVICCVRSGEKILSDVSFHIEPGEFIALTGPSRSGKTTLMHSLAGYKKPSEGEISIDGVSLYANPKAFRSAIGFVPSDYALHPHLTVTETLLDASRLRLPRATSHQERQMRVQALLEAADLTRVAGAKVDRLSKLNIRKLSIAVEVSGSPGLLLLDESSERFAHYEEMQIATYLRKLSYQGVTIIQVNQLSPGIRLTDKVIFLAPGGRLAWFGPVDEAFEYFGSFQPADRPKDGLFFEEALETLADSQFGDGSAWAERFKAHPAYPKYVDNPLNDRYPDLLHQSQPVLRLRSKAQEKQPPLNIPHPNPVQELVLLTRRNFRILWRGKTWLWMAVVPLLVACFDFFLSSPSLLDAQLGDPGRPPVVFGMLVFLDLIVSALLFHNEIFKERRITQHERRVNPSSFPYIGSKLGLVAMFAIYQGIVWSIIHFVATGLVSGLQVLAADGITFTLMALIGGLIGLIASTLARTAEIRTAWLLVLTVPQLFLSGAILPLSQNNGPLAALAALNPSRYAFETLLTTSGYALDVANDPCWQLPPEQRSALTDAQKGSCACMGNNLFSVCRFPGIHSFYSFIIEQPQPAAPEASSAINAIPVLPVIEPGETLNKFATEMNTYAAQMETYLGKTNAYLSAWRQYSDRFASWQRNRSLVIGNAEGVIREALDHYGQAFQVDRVGHWSILVGMILVLILLLFGIQQGKAGSIV